MSVVIGLFAMLCAILVMLVLLAFILTDIENAKKYRNAMRAPGIICENYGVEEVAHYGRHQYRKYGKYLVQFETPIGVQTREIILKNKKLQRGNWAEVRYVMGQEGVQVVNNISGTRLIELGITFLVVLPLCLIYIFFKEG